MRALDLAALALILGASLLVVEASWTPPAITPADASQHIGHHVQITGFAVDARESGDGGQVTLVADGAAIHAWFDGETPAGWVQATGIIDRDGGLPVLRITTWDAAHVAPEATTLQTIAADPGRFVDRAVTIAGSVQGHRLTAHGITLRLAGEIDPGWHELTGLLRYDATCLCHVLHT